RSSLAPASAARATRSRAAGARPKRRVTPSCRAWEQPSCRGRPHRESRGSLSVPLGHTQLLRGFAVIARGPYADAGGAASVLRARAPRALASTRPSLAPSPCEGGIVTAGSRFPEVVA